jgi:hypothetical protein
MVVPLENLTVKELTIQYCQQEIQLGERFLKHWPHAGDGLIGRGQFLALASLVPFLEDSDIHPLFTSACNSLHFTTRIVPALRTLLGTVEAIAWSMNQKIPSLALQYFQKLEQVADVRDLPTSFVLPQLRDFPAIVEEDQADDGPGKTGNEMSRLIAKWSALTVDT